MSKSTRNTVKLWAPSQIRQLKQLANQNTPTRVIGFKLSGTGDAIRSKASENNISLNLTINHLTKERNEITAH